MTDAPPPPPPGAATCAGDASVASTVVLECHTCGSKQQPISLCCNCHTVGFCSPLCERAAWDGGHSRVCTRPRAQPPPPPPTASTEPGHAGASSEELKTTGNRLYSQRLFLKSVGYYTAAIAADAMNPVLFSNRSAAWWELVQ
jgi:hypothetical protein